jgi:CheY-like chemotaxis protein
MVIEDEPIHLKLAKIVFSTEGYDVIGVETAEKALEIIKENKPEIILVDLELPGMNGVELISQLKQDPVTNQIILMAVTAYPNKWSKREVIKAGCDLCIIKPISTRTITKEVARVISKKTS